MTVSSEDSLTARQQEIVDCNESSFVQACPGAGKTRTMVSLFMRVVAALPARQGAAVVSYTNCAADEIRERCARCGRPEYCEYPHFVGTFDAFVARYLVIPFGSRWAPAGTRVRICDSWESVGLEVPVPTKNGKRVSVPLDAFPLNLAEEIELDLSRVPAAARSAVQAQTDLVVRSARAVREKAWRRGYLSCDDARVCAILRLRDGRGARLLTALAARFRTLIVDESQDCSQVDLEILTHLRDAGIQTVAVADPDQAIFGFRGADPTALAAFGAPMRPFSLAENFRSSQIICHFASSLRRSAAADAAIGCHAADPAPIILMPYGGNGGHELGQTFSSVLARFGVAEIHSIVVAHQLVAALRATGRPTPVEAGTSAPWRLADAVVRFRAATGDPRALLATPQVVERLLLSRLGVAAQGMSPDHAAEEQSIDIRWLRAEGLRLLVSLARVPLEDRPEGRWIERARRLLGDIQPHPGRAFQRSPQQVLPDLAGFSLRADSGLPAQAVPAATVHSVKGREYQGVMIVLPRSNRSESVVKAWEGREQDEARSVLYVAATRARRLLAIAIPSPLLESVHRLTIRDGASCEIVPVPAGTALPRRRSGHDHP